MYPGTIFNWYDQSEITAPVTPTTVDDAPLFFQVFSSDKGTEDLIEISGDNFAAMYGTMSFTKHGQSAIQAQNIINAGGRLLAKRVVAPDSYLANVVFVANITESGDGAQITWTKESIANCTSFDDVKIGAKDLYEAGKSIPMFIMADNGRGVSKKAVRITPDYTTSKTIGTMFYTFTVYEGTTQIEQKAISLDPNVVYNNIAYRLDEFTCTQIIGLVDDSYFSELCTILAEATNEDVNLISKYDLINGCSNTGLPLSESIGIDITIDTENSINLDTDTGIVFENGDNGAFGNAPFGLDGVPCDEWTQAVIDVFNGTFSDKVYDVDTYKIAAIVDANYPDEVKMEICGFVNFRKDCVFFRDYGLDLNTYLEIREKRNTLDSMSTVSEIKDTQRSYFIADYASSYMIKDPSTKKNIKVTMCYDLAAKLVQQIANGAAAPVAGMINGFTMDNAIKDTISFVPIHTPTSNQKEAMEDLKVNYCIFNGNQCVVQSSYSAQDKYTQLSYINNVLAIQYVLRAVRDACPRHRYSLATASDLSTYADAVQNVLNKFTRNFDVLRFEYTQDALKASQKIFYASIKFAFLNWAQTEIFDIYAIANDVTVS